MSAQPSPREKQARHIFSAPPAGDPAELLALALALRDEENNIEYARRVLQVTSQLLDGASADLHFEVLHALVICTYKSPDQPLDRRLDEAAALANELLLKLDDAKRGQDLLGILGSICKLRWSAYGLRDQLEASLTYYLDGMALGIECDRGYTAVNAAFVLDLLGREGARPIREQVRDTLLSLAAAKPTWLEDFWFLATLGETCLGLREFAEATSWMERAAQHPPHDWQLESTARQTAKLASLIAIEMKIAPDQLAGSKPWDVVRALLGGDADAALSFILGKVGLALSGGGFRASLFHIGFLARLAELDMLRHVEVLSCVSGGSILGAFYYLELRNMLQETTDSDLDRDDYIKVVQRIQTKFLAGVQKNIRLRMLMEFGSNWRVLTSRRSSMTDRLAHLYDRELFALVEDEFGKKPRSLTDILIHPKDDPEFNPKYQNWQRRHKVPILILNATTLNTSHNWQFTASFMGEPPSRAAASEIEANDRLRRMYYDDAPADYQALRLSEAVAASACVPGFFDPLSLDGLYGTKAGSAQPLDYVTRLVDGGAYDNQGVASLLEQNCTVLLVSDACGQGAVSMEPGGGRLDVVKRTNDILMARVREAQFQYLIALRDSRALHGLLYVHLKEDLAGESVDWLGSKDRSPQTNLAVLTPYGMRRDVQALLAGIRTDLDSFSDCEADALMLSGYLMARAGFANCILSFPVSSKPEAQWRFRSIEPIATSKTKTKVVEELLAALEIATHIGRK
ncbi:MAG TPA: patatin-like phospholipase family protein, partial [Bryobacteraceae bacterium]|nr:patatin-like phospholipase family protein [Bryobacteraceae bacterium]